MDCAAVKPRMEALVNGSLPAPERALAEQHIAICEGCRLELELVRAIGSQEKPPTVGQDDWTLDRIFGSESQQKNAGQPASAQPATPAPAPADSDPMSAEKKPNPPAAVESMFDSVAGGKEHSSEPEPSGSAPTSWDFEPADAKADVKPPEESLFFATEALSRRSDPEAKKGSGFRVILWGVGGLVGAILLAFSSWLVLHMTAPGGDDSAPMEVPAKPSAGDAPSGEAPGEAPDPGALPPTDEDTAPPSDMAAEPSDVTAERAPAAGVHHRVSASSGVPPPPLPTASRAPGAAARQAPPAANQTPGRSTQPQAIPTPARSTPPAVTRAAPPSATAPNAGSGGAQTFTRPPPPKPWQPPPDDEEPVAHEPAPPPTQEKPRSKSWLDSLAGSAAAPTAPPDAGKPSAETGTDPAAASPIDRLHLATVAAEERGDLPALRRLRSSWKSFISKMGVGPQRARAKREYADCLWAIQSLTGSRADQKNALAAYREYLLGAPAGGADSRTVSRLRELEDALAEGR